MHSAFRLSWIAFLLIHFNTSAQLLVTPYDPVTAATMLMGSDVSVFNVTYSGDPVQLGWSSNIQSFPTDSGLILSSSNAQNFIPNSFFGDPTNPLNTEPDLLTIANSVPPLIGQSFTVSGVYDVAILEFDFVAPSANMDLNFVYGSDEYLTYVNSQYNDVFAILLGGPGIAGPYAAPAGFPNGAANLALVPESNPPLPITVSSVNNVLNNNYYINNPGNVINTNVSLTGYTDLITVNQALTPGATYHLKLAIADGSDSGLKSLMIMNTASFSGSSTIEVCAAIQEEFISICPGESVELNSIPSNNEGLLFDNGIYIPDNQGCLQTEQVFTEFGSAVIDDVSDINNIYFNMEHSFVGDINISIICPDGSVMSIFPEAGGSGTFLGEPIDDLSGTPGVGYTYSFSPFSAGGTWMEYLSGGGASPIPAGDYAPEGSFTDLIGCPLNGSWTLEVCDFVGSDDGWVFEFGVVFSGSSMTNSYYWSTGETTSNIVLNPEETTTYYLYSEANGESCVDSVIVHVEPPVQISSNGPPVVCNGNSVVLTASGAITYQWNTGSTSNQLTVNNPGTYTITGFSEGCVSEQSISISGSNQPIEIAAEATEFCSGDTITIASSANLAEYFWNNGATGNTIEITTGGNYFVAGTDAFGCDYSSEIITITEFPFDNSITASDDAICDGESVTLGVNPENDIVWSNGESTPNLIVTEPGTYYALVTNGPCSDYTSSIEISEGITPIVDAFAVDDSLCNDGSTTLLFGTPAGGIWEGPGMDGNTFQSSLTGTGEFVISYVYTNPAGCSGTTNETISVQDCSLISEAATNSAFSVYPNPTNNYFLIENHTHQRFTFEIFDMSGKRIQSGTSQENEWISLNLVQSGFYTVRISGANSTLVYPIVKL